MRQALIATVLSFLSAGIVLAAAPRRSIVMGVGEVTVVTTSSSIATVTTPPGAVGVVSYVPEQYGNTISVTAVKKGESKLLIESTQSRVSEIINVIVADKTVAARYRFVTGSLAGIEGLQPADFTTGENAVIVGGTVYSSRDLQRCRAIDTSAAKPNAKTPVTFCVARLSSALPAVTPDAAYEPAASVTFTEAPLPAAAGAIEGSEGTSNWSAVVRLGDVPVLELASANRSDLFVRAARLAAQMNRISGAWRTAAEKRAPYPVTFVYFGTATGYDLAAQWKFDQGTRGETLIKLTPDDLLQATMRSGGGTERLIQWGAALMQDAFRMYYMAAVPVRSSVGAAPLLKETYLKAVSLNGGPVDRTNAATAVARAVAAKRWSSGRDPFDGILTTIPSEFQPPPITR